LKKSLMSSDTEADRKPFMRARSERLVAGFKRYGDEIVAADEDEARARLRTINPLNLPEISPGANRKRLRDRASRHPAGSVQRHPMVHRKSL